MKDIIKIIPSWKPLDFHEDLAGNVVDYKDKYHLCVHLEINGKVIDFYTDPNDVAFKWNQSTKDWYRECRDKHGIKDCNWSVFHPFTCSCGVAGCAGIWDGIYVKIRKHTVEWKVREGDGYDFLDQRFYSFDRVQYEQTHKDFMEWLDSFKNDRQTRFVELGNFVGDELNVEDFLEGEAV